ncbi:hypothetical protein TIFTF001_034109 [Ficus carica]|uniref:Uncharacterized protein n=1 Tax=Ficus carica TaxID=3494 RepID=A0AA88DZV1_FICCA|nr:hypothetical protein TIFTF001_034109 [Ficus carica]
MPTSAWKPLARVSQNGHATLKSSSPSAKETPTTGSPFMATKFHVMRIQQIVRARGDQISRSQGTSSRSVAAPFVGVAPVVTMVH